MNILDGYVFRGYRRSTTSPEACVGLLQSLSGDEITLALVAPGTQEAPKGTTTTSAANDLTSNAQGGLTEAAVAAARADLDIEFVLSSSSSAWSSSFSSIEDAAEAEKASPLTAATSTSTITSQLPAHGSTFLLTKSPAAIEVERALRRTYGAETGSLWWVLMGYSQSGGCAYLCPHHTRLASVRSATAAAAQPFVSFPVSDTLFARGSDDNVALLREITHDILSGHAGKTTGPDSDEAAAHHFIRVPVGCVSPAAASQTVSAPTLIWSPPLDTHLLSIQFGVTGRPHDEVVPDSAVSQCSSASQIRNSSIYVLAKTERTPVQFLGVALGVPWVIDAEGVDESAVNGSTARGGLSRLDYADPLPGCYQADSLVREYGLRGSQPPTPSPPPPAEAAAAAAAPGVLQAVSPASQPQFASTMASESYTDAPARPDVTVPSTTPERHTPPPPAPTDTALPSPLRPTSLPYFAKGRKIAVPGPYGVLLECDVSAAVLEKKFGVAHADRLRVRDDAVLREVLTTSENEELDVASHTATGPSGALYVTVMGVAMGAPVILFDEERKAVPLRSVRGVDGMRTRFIKVSGSELPPPALPTEPEEAEDGHAVSAAALANHQSVTPASGLAGAAQQSGRRPAYDDFRSSTSSDTDTDGDVSVDEVTCTDGDSGKRAVPDSEAPPPADPIQDDAEAAAAALSPSATPSQLPGVASEGNAYAGGDDLRDASLAPTELRASPPDGNTPAAEPSLVAASPEESAPVVAEGAQSYMPIRPNEDTDAAVQVADTRPGAARGPDALSSAVAPAQDRTEEVGPITRDVSASPGIIVPTTARLYDALRDEEPGMSSTPLHTNVADCRGAAATTSHTFTDFLKAYALYQLERDARAAGRDLDRGLSIGDLQRYYQVQPLKRVMAAVEAQRRCLWLWGREGQFPSVQYAHSAWSELCVDEVAEYLFAKESVLAALVPH